MWGGWIFLFSHLSENSHLRLTSSAGSPQISPGGSSQIPQRVGLIGVNLMIALFALFPILMFGTVVFAALSAHTEHEAREAANEPFACCDERRALMSEHQLVA